MAELTQRDLPSGGFDPSLSASGRPINQRSIFFASFMTLIAAGIGFAVRGGILGDWGAQFGFTKSDLGNISGAGLAGFGFTIIFFSFFADAFGYRALLLAAFVLLVLSGRRADRWPRRSTTPPGQQATYWTLYIGTFIFSLAQGLCEAAINPLTATLFPKQKTHYLNILHAGWPRRAGARRSAQLPVRRQDAAVLATSAGKSWPRSTCIPTLYFGFVVLKNQFPISEAKAAGVGARADDRARLVAPMLLFLFLIHAMVGYVELGTDSWIQNIMKTRIGNKASLLFAYTSILMFILRFFAGPIVHKINPLGLLFIAACCGATGLYLLGSDQHRRPDLRWPPPSSPWARRFYWPTMLGVIGERFPRGGARGDGLLRRHRHALRRLPRRPRHRLHPGLPRLRTTSKAVHHVRLRTA